jgi:hypothetical protein
MKKGKERVGRGRGVRGWEPGRREEETEEGRGGGWKRRQEEVGRGLRENESV